MSQILAARDDLSTAVKATEKVIIKPSFGWSALNLRDLWRYRELVYFLTWRDIKVRYKQSLLGVAWAVLQPLLTMLVFTVIFGRLMGVASDGQQYELFSFAALLPWTLFSGALSRASMSLVGSANLLTKIYFPRLVIPVAAVGASLVDFAVSFVFLIGLLLFFGTVPTWNILWLPLLVILAILSALAVGLWLSALNVQYRDVQHMIPFIVQLWFYASPIVYSLKVIDKLPDPWWTLYSLNPMVGVVQGFRWAILGGDPPNQMLFLSAAVVIVLLVSGLFYFRRMEKTFADTV